MNSFSPSEKAKLYRIFGSGAFKSIKSPTNVKAQKIFGKNAFRTSLSYRKSGYAMNNLYLLKPKRRPTTRALNWKKYSQGKKVNWGNYLKKQNEAFLKRRKSRYHV